MPKGILKEMKLNSKRNLVFALVGTFIAISLPSSQLSAIALDCTKPSDAKSKACKKLQQTSNKVSQSEEVNAGSALAQKNAAIAARKAAEAKASKAPVTLTTPVATTIPVPKLTPVTTTSPSPEVSTSPSASLSPTASSTPTAGATSGKLLKITCVKGSSQKVVSGSTPKCPSGYRKK
jgi:hypothetical protein